MRTGAISSLITLDIVGIVIVAHVGTWVLVIRGAYLVAVLTVTATEDLVDFPRSIDQYRRGRGRGRIAAAIDLLDTGHVAAVDNHFGILRCCLIVGLGAVFCRSVRFVLCQVTTAIDSQYIVLLVGDETSQSIESLVFQNLQIDCFDGVIGTFNAIIVILINRCLITIGECYAIGCGQPSQIGIVLSVCLHRNVLILILIILITPNSWIVSRIRMLRSIDMHQDVSLWRSVLVVTAKDASDRAALGSAFDTLIQFHSGITSDVGLNRCHTTLDSLAATVGIMHDIAADQLDIGTLSD